MVSATTTDAYDASEHQQSYNHDLTFHSEISDGISLSFNYKSFITDLRLEDLTASVVISLVSRLSPTIRRLHLSDGLGGAMTLTHQNFSRLLYVSNGLKGLKTFRLGSEYDAVIGQGMVRAFQQQLQQRDPLPDLVSLDIGNTVWAEDTLVLNVVPMLVKNLIVLDLGNSAYTYTSETLLAVCKSLRPQMESISLSYQNISEELMEEMGTRFGNSLRALCLSYSAGVTDSVVSLIRKHLVNLRVLDMGRCTNVTETGWAMLSNTVIPNLTDLSLAECRLEISQLTRILSKAQLLRWLDISDPSHKFSENLNANFQTFLASHLPCLEGLGICRHEANEEAVDLRSLADFIFELSMSHPKMMRIYHGGWNFYEDALSLNCSDRRWNFDILSQKAGEAGVGWLDSALVRSAVMR
jgi:hypothetical protein